VSLKLEEVGPDDLDDPVEHSIMDTLWAAVATTAGTTLTGALLRKALASTRRVLREEFLEKVWFYKTRYHINWPHITGTSILTIVYGGYALLCFLMLPAAPGVTTSLLIGVAVLCIAAIIIGLALALNGPRYRTRAAQFLAEQAAGFRTYLENVSASQIAWDKNPDIFSHYLPYAIALGCSEQWMETVNDAVFADARVVPPPWCSENLTNPEICSQLLKGLRPTRWWPRG